MSIFAETDRQEITGQPGTGEQRLSSKNISDLLAFIEALTDFSAEDGRKTVPMRVPNSLPLAEIK